MYKCAFSRFRSKKGIVFAVAHVQADRRIGKEEMAIYHLTVNPIRRSQNHKAIAAAAYRSGEKLKDDRYVDPENYSRRKGIVHREIMAPANAPDWVYDRETLWNRVEKGEKRRDAQLAREIEFAIPRELSFEDQLTLVRRFVADETVSRGMIADFAIHEREASDGGTNPHAHIMLTFRRISPEGFARTKERDWNKTSLLRTWRKNWEVYCNEALEAAGETARIDHRTLEAQGILREPTIHIGKDAFHADQKGQDVERTKRQLSDVERSLAPFTKQIQEHGHLNLKMTPELVPTWWEHMTIYTQRISDTVQEWYGRARDTVQSWVERWGSGQPDHEPTMGR